MINTSEIQKNIGYYFNDPELLKLALTHRSYSTTKNNQRLEFLGDSVLSLVVAEFMYKNTEYKAGDMTNARSQIVNGDYLFGLPVTKSISAHILVGYNEQKNSVNVQKNALEDAFEALVAAIYLDSDIKTVSACIYRWLKDDLKKIQYAKSGSLLLKDAKNRLQEVAQLKGNSLPIYKVLEIGDGYVPFKIMCIFGAKTAKATHLTKKKAEQLAAELMLEKLIINKKK